tara:strand:+ start:61 stop:1359 length:1299 start_codon:yes stop_codon:yes gene_type:complete
MLEGKALVVAIMMLTAAPLVVTDDGRAIVGDVTSDVTDMFTEEKSAKDPKRDEVLDDAADKTNGKDLELDRKELASKDTKEEKSCYYLEEIKEEMSSDKKDKDEERKDDSDVEDRENESKEREEESSEITSLIGMDRQDALDLLEESGVTYRYCDLDDEDGCVMTDDYVIGRHTLEIEDSIIVSHEVEEELDDDSEKDEYDEEFYALMEELKIACEDGNEESCEELRSMIAEIKEEKGDDIQLVIGDDGVVYYEDKDRKDWNKEDKDWNKEDKDWDEACLTMEEWKEVFEKDRKERDHHHKDDYREMSIEYMMEMFEEIDEEAIAEIKQITNMSDEEWDQMIVKLETNNMTEEDWKTVMEKMETVFEHKMKEEREEMEAFRAQIKEFDDACEAGNETACEELEVMMAEIEEDLEEDREEKENREECDEHSDE